MQGLTLKTSIIMTDKKVKPKRTAKTEVAKEVKDLPKKQEPSPFVWLYGVHNKVVLKAAASILNPLTDQFFSFRKQLGLRLDTPIIPVYPDARGRLDIIDALELALSEMPEDTIILVVGQTEDLKIKRITEQYKGDRYHFVHPAERQFYIDTNSVISYKKAEERKVELKKQLDEIFVEV